MQIYKNLDGDSGVVGFVISADSITVYFERGYNTAYTYNYNSAGRAVVESMKALALGGKGLNAFINTQAKKKYAYKTAW